MKRSIFLALALLFSVAFVSASLSNTTTAYYKFDESSGTSAADATGNANTASVGTADWVSGKIGNAIDLDGGSTSYNVDTPVSLGSSSFSIAGWIYIPTVGSWDGLLTTVTNDGSRDGILLGVRSTQGWRVAAYASDSNIGVFETYTAPSSATWYHYAITYNDSTDNVTFYLDGEVEDSMTLSGELDAHDENLYLGASYTNQAGDHGESTQDETGVWVGTTLSSSEVETLYNSGSGLQYPYGPAPPSNVTLTAVDAYDGSSINEFNSSVYVETNFTDEVGIGGNRTYEEQIDYFMVRGGPGTEIIALPSFCDANPTVIERVGTIGNSEFECYNSTGALISFLNYSDSLPSGWHGLIFNETTSTTNGTVQTDVSSGYEIEPKDSGGGTYTPYPAWLVVNVTRSDYFEPDFGYFQANESTYETTLTQAYASFSCFELYTNASLTCDESGPFTRKAGSYTTQVNVTGYHPVNYSYTLSALENETFNVTGFYDHQLTINATDYNGTALTNFTLSVESNLTSFNVTDNNTGSVVLPLLQGYLYNVTITQNVPEGIDRNNSIETETFNVTTSSESYQFNLTFPRLYINVYDEQTNLFVEDTTTITFSKGNESFTLNTTTGRLNLTGLEAIESGEYSVFFENSAYNPRTYDLTYNRTYAQTLNAYLVPLEAPSTIFTLEDSQSRIPVEGATVTIQRYVNGTLTTVLSLESDITGRVGFDYIPDRQYEFEITMTGYETRSFTLNPILFSSYTILLEPSISFGEIGGDFSGVGITFSTTRFTESQTNNLTLSFSDPSGGLVSYGYNVSTDTSGQVASESGSNAYGSILPSSFAIPDVPLYDQVRVDYYYERSDGVVRTFTTSYSITQVNAYQNQTWVNNRQIAENIAPLDRAAIVVIATGALSALAYTFVGLGGASLSAIVLLGFFAYSGFINGWIVAISIIGFMFLLLGRGSQ